MGPSLCPASQGEALGSGRQGWEADVQNLQALGSRLVLSFVDAAFLGIYPAPIAWLGSVLLVPAGCRRGKRCTSETGNKKQMQDVVQIYWCSAGPFDLSEGRGRLSWAERQSDRKSRPSG